MPGRVIRVAHVVHGLMMGGLEQMVVRLCAAGRPLGIAPIVVAFGADGAMGGILEREGVPVVYLGEVRGMSGPAVTGIARAFREHDIDIAHAHDTGPWLNAMAAKALAPRTRVMATFHQIAEPAGLTRGMSYAAALMSEALVACGGEVRACLERWVPTFTRVELVGNGIPIGPPATDAQRAEARRRLGVPPEAKVVGYLGRLHHEKGPDLLFDAYQRFLADRPDVHLVLIGKGPTGHAGDLEPSLRQRAARNPRIHLPGELVDATALLPAFDVYVQPSRREGRSLSMLEAMAAGLPTVAQGLPAIREIHRNGETALLVPPSERPSLGPAIVQLLDDPTLRARMGEAARLHARAFSVDEMARQYAALYAEFCRGGQAFAASSPLRAGGIG